MILGTSIVAQATPGICAFPFLDSNGNGQYDQDSEPRLADWQVCVDGSNCKLTNEAGGACFLPMPTGRYDVCLTLRDGFENTTPLCQLVDVLEGRVAQAFFGVRPAPAGPGGLFPSDVGDESTSAFESGLGQSFPNPFRSDVWIGYRVPDDASGVLQLDIFDASGRVLRRLETAAIPGVVAFHWDGQDARGVDAPAGVYFYGVVGSDGAPGRMIRIK
jgi:hypothetical protein